MRKDNKKKSQEPRAEKSAGSNPLIGKTVVGKLDMARSGMGFVIVADSSAQDVVVKAADLKSAMNGDEVKVKITYVSQKGRPEGFITEVVKRNQTEFIGKIQITEKFGFVVPNNRNINTDIFIPPSQLKNVKHGDTVVARVVEWQGNGKSKNPVGEIIEVLSQERINQVAMKEILVECGFPLTFSPEAIQEAEALPTNLDRTEISLRRDMRDVLTITIDPLDAKDFDDAISYQALENDLLEIGVHIADVSHYVVPGSALDKDAYTRATSVYLPDRVLPMLPEKISNELCSLRPNEDKFTFSAVFKMDKKGKVKSVWIGRTVTHSDRRFTYEEAQEMIEGAPGPFREEIMTLHALTQNLRAERFKKGAINFSSQEIRFKLDEQGIPLGIVIKESKAAHQLIEELMLMANKHVAIFVGEHEINNKPVPFPYRLHDVPDEKKLETFSNFASRFGYKMNLNSPEKIASSFNELLQFVNGKPEQHVLEQLGIRTMAKAIYGTDNIGHYGLGFEDYCHFTSPIRRYPDVMVHRVVQECLDEIIVADKQMDIKCQHCSERERKAMEAERAGNKYKQVEFMQQFLGETFDAVISGVSSFGFWAETVEHKCEGLISIADLTDLDQFEFVEADYALVGLHTGIHFRIGDKVSIQVVATDLEKRQIDFGLVHTSIDLNALKRGKSKITAARDATQQKRKEGAKEKQQQDKGAPKKAQKGNKKSNKKSKL